ncbi:MULTISPECIES: WhiB family transcriptional regulator [unclassified Streptomyces]|uniref:WhiB family transcriptional regulator n=1 Tax=unclassified Streptomyces TaxID=2593676 RepID=UPI0033AC49FD
MNPAIALEGICAQVDPGLFFPRPGDHASSRAAKTICFDCPVQRACLTEALALEGGADKTHRYGIRGGTTPRERANLARGAA